MKRFEDHNLQIFEYDYYTQPFIRSGIYIQSFRKKKEILSILHDPDASHYQRVWLVGFLKYIGCENHEIFDLIDKNNNWLNYDKQKTKYMIEHTRTLAEWANWNDKYYYYAPRQQTQREEYIRENILHVGDVSGHDQDREDLQTRRREVGNVVWKDVGGTIRHFDMGYGKFLEVCLRESDEGHIGLVISNGQYGLTKEGNCDPEKKIYKNRLFISMNNGAREWLIKQLTELGKSN